VPPDPARQALHEQRRALAVFAVFAAIVIGAGVIDGSGDDLPGRAVKANTLVPAGEQRVGKEPASRLLSRSARAINDVLDYTSYISRGTDNKPEIALTFDDGPSIYTSKLLRALVRMRVPATFFVMGRRIRERPEVLRREFRLGFEVANHTIDHPFMSRLSRVDQMDQIDGNSSLLRSNGVPASRLFRPPYRAFNDTTLRLLERRRMLMVLWSVDSEDYTRPGTAQIVKNVIKGAQPGAIVLMHDGGGNRLQTLAAVPRIVRALRRRYYRLVTVSQLIVDDPPPHIQPLPGGLGAGG
jgi:peptidoglycan/xylan/chitin deacetylase (PgdA/CDA1 family)